MSFQPVNGFCLKFNMSKGFKYRIYPNKEKIIQLAKTFGCCRFVYNQILAKKIELYETSNMSISKTDGLK